MRDTQTEPQVILVDETDTPIGSKAKLQAHIDGDLHRCFSIILFNKNGEMLLQKRALCKYHCGGLWTNACCSHPAPGEDTLAGAKRRLYEELGYRDVELKALFQFIYRAEFANGLIEHEYDHAYSGIVTHDPPKVDPEEVAETKWISLNDLEEDLAQNPETYTVWFGLILAKLRELGK